MKRRSFITAIGALGLTTLGSATMTFKKYDSSSSTFVSAPQRKYDTSMATDWWKGTPIYQYDSSIGEFTDVFLDDGLVAYYDFQDHSISGSTLKDRSSNSNDGTLNGSPTATDGIVGDGLNFDGTDDTISIPADPSLDIQTGDFSIAAWVRTDIVADNDIHVGHGIIEKKPVTGAGDNATGYMLQVTAKGHYNTNRFLNNKTVFAYGDGSSLNYLESSTLGCGPWYHLAVTFDVASNTVTMYHDGKEQVSQSFASSPVNNNYPVQLGTHHTGGGSVDRWLDGALSEVRLYNRILDPVEIETLAAVGSSPGDSFHVDFNTEIFDVFNDPLLIYDSTRSPPYLISVYGNAQENTYGSRGNNLYESSDRVNWTLVQNDITGENTNQDYVYVDGTYYVYTSDDADTFVWTGPDFTSLTLQGTVLTGLSDCGAFYDDSSGTYYLFPEENPKPSSPSSYEIGIYTSSSGTSGFTKAGTALDFIDRSYGTGDVDVELIDGVYWMFFDTTSDHPYYGTGLARSDDLMNWEFLTDSIKNDYGGDLDVIETPDGIFGVTEFSLTDADGIGLWDLTKV